MPKLIKLPKWLRVPSPKDLGKSISNSLPMRDVGNPENKYSWCDWEEEVQSKFPIRYFLFETMPHKFTVKITMPIQETIYWLKCKLFKKYKFHLIDIRNTNYPHDSLGNYRYGYCDPLNQILYASFKILSKYVEECDSGPRFQITYLEEELKKNDPGMYGSLENIKQKIADYELILDLYDWWNFRRPEFLKQYDEALSRDSDKDKSLGYFERYKDTNYWEERIKKEENEALKKLADVREYLWY